MSIWNSFKKKVNETWSGLDAWDEEENRRQRQQFATARQPQPTPVNNGGSALRVQTAQPTQRVVVDQPDYSNKQVLTVDAPPIDPVNAGLNAGKSWQEISRETGADVGEIEAYSKSTRPNYGIKRMERPKQSNWNKFRDVLDANTDADKFRRQEQNDKSLYENDVPLTWEKPGNVVGATVGAIPRMFNTAANQIVEVGYTGQQQFATAEYSAATEQYQKAVKTGDPRNIAAAKVRLDGAVQRVQDINNALDATKSNYDTEGGLFNVGTLYNKQESEEGSLKGAGKIALGTGEGMLDVATLGLSSVTGKQVLKVGVKQAVKESAPTLAKVGVMNATQGGFSSARQGGDAGDIATSALLSGTAGTVGDVVLAGGGALVVKGKNKIVSQIATPNVKMATPDVPVKVPEVDAPSVYQAVNPVTKERIYKTIDPQDFEGAKVAIDGPDGIAGKRQSDGFVAHITAKTPADMEALGFTNAGKYTTGVDDIMTPPFKPETPITTPKIEVGKTQSLADLLPNIGDRKAMLTTKVDDMKSTYNNLKPDVIDRLVRDYGEEKTANILASTRDATNIRDMNGFVISEAKKRFGDPAVKIQGSKMSPEEEAALFASAPPVRVEAPVETPPLRVEAPPVEQLVPNVPNITPPTGKLGTMADEFYQSTAGNTKVKFRDLERLGQKISQQVDLEFKAIGTDFATVARKVQEGARNGAKSLDEAGLTPDEAVIMRNAQEEMNYVRRRASTGKREIKGGDYGELYLPQQKPGQYAGENLFEGFRATKPGSENIRKNRIELEDLDYSPEVVGEYIARYGDTKLYREERLGRALAKNNPNIDEDTLADATRKLIDIQDKLNSVKTKIGAFGFGTRQQVDNAGEFVDTSKQMSDLGLQLGHELDVITDAPKGLTNGDRINSISTNGEKLGDRLGLNQHRDAETFASKQFTDSAGDRTVLAGMVEERLRSVYKLDDEAIDYAVGGVSRIAPNVPDEVVLARVTSTYKNAAKQQLMEELQYVDIANVKLRKDVSGLANQILREGTMESELSAKVVSKILQTQNAIFRKLNVSSALNELSDINSFASVYGKKLALIPDFSTIKEFGLGEIDAAIEPYVRALASGKQLPEILKTINSKTNLYKFVEHYKAAVVATSAKNTYGAQGLTGDALAKRVLDDYRNLALPVDAFTKTFLDNTPLYTQYMTWGVRNIQKEGRLATGKMSGGVLDDMSTKQRIARNAYANLPAKTVFWLSSNALKGTSILTAFGMTDFTGMTNQDYSGIAEEDKSWFDKTTQFTNSSTTLSMLNSVIQSYEKEQLKDKYKDADYNPYEYNNPGKDIANKFTPQFIKNVTGTNEMIEKGYSENKGGRVQYEAPTDWWNTTKSYLFGKGQTDNARDYSGRESVFQRDGNPITNIADMAQEQLGIKEGDYTRPLTDTYSDAYKKADEGARTAMLEGGRQFNKYLDDLKKDNKPAYDNYISAMDGNHVNPEYWKTIAGGDAGKPDLANFNMIKSRKKQEAKDLGKKYDPLYDLNDDQARAVIQQKSVATGDDIALRNSLYKEQWYKDYQKKVKDFYDGKEETDSDYETTQRVRDWYALNDQYNGIRTTKTDDGKEPEWAKNYPLVFQQKALTEQFGFDSDASKNFFKANGDAYRVQKDAYDATQLEIINKMRVIEGYPAMSAEQFEQVSKVVDTDKDSKDKKKYGSGGGGSDKVSIQTGDYGKARGLELPSVKIQVAKQKRVAKYATKNVKIKRTKAKM